jgi:hypothetical protein
MSEQAVLIPSVPPVASPGSVQANLLSPQGDSGASVLVDAASLTITPFQNVVFISSLAAACMIGFAAVLAFQQSAKRSQAVTALYRTFGIFLVLLTLHALIANRLFASYLNQNTAEASLAYRMAGWIVLAPLLTWVRALFLGYEKSKHGLRPLISALLTGLAFVLLAIALPASVRANAALVFALMAIALYVVIIARAASFKNQLQSRKSHPLLLRGPSLQMAWIGCTILPALLAVIGFAKLLGMHHDAAHFAVTVTEFFTVTIIFVGLLNAKGTGAEVAVASAGNDELPVQPATKNEVPVETVADDPYDDPMLAVDAGIPDPFAMPTIGNSGDSFGETPKTPPPASPRKVEPRPAPVKNDKAPTPKPEPTKETPVIVQKKVTPLPDAPAIKSPPKPKSRFNK